jgi:hypothetical protein
MRAMIAIALLRRLGAPLAASMLALTLPLATGCGGDDAGVATTPPKPPTPPPTFPYPLDDVLRLNHAQMKGTHNSYHIKPELDIDEWRYTHAPLDVQLAAQGVRKVELDTYYNEALGAFEVYHVGVLDDQSTCRRFTDCLKLMKTWSDKNPAHNTIFIQIEPKDAFDAAAAETYFQRLEEEILSVWYRERLVTPEDVQGGAASLREAITTKGWPTLRVGRAKALFFMDNSAEFRDHYTHGGSDLEGRIMFASGDPGTPRPCDGVYVLNDPITDAGAITDALAAGFLVRTRADSDSKEPLAGDTTRREAALAGGAQIVSTDYPAKTEGVDYVMEIPGGTPSRCNPITAPPECTPEAIEDPKFFTSP